MEWRKTYSIIGEKNGRNRTDKMASNRSITDRDTPLRLVRRFERAFPGIYKELDFLQKGWREMPDYDPRCELPIAAAYTWLVEKMQANDMEAAQLAAGMTCCYLWQKNPVIYAYDPDLADMLYRQADENDDAQIVPWEIFLRLPYPCVYIKAPGMRDNVDGFFVWVEHDVNSGVLELRMQSLDTDMDKSIPFALHLLPGATLADCLDDTRRVTQFNFREYNDELSVPEHIRQALLQDWTQMILRPLQLVLYLCAANSEIETRQVPRLVRPTSGNGPARPKKECKASDVAAFDIGVRIGASIRRAAQYNSPARVSEPGTGSPKRPHSRRGHWHHYWTGPHTGKRELVLKWTPPTFIHADDAGPAPVVQIPIKN